MARHSLIKKNLKQRKLFQKFSHQRVQLKNELKSGVNSLQLLQKIQKLPRNSAKTRLQKRCFLTGSARKVNRFCGLSRHSLREFMKEGLLPGMTKSSW